MNIKKLHKIIEKEPKFRIKQINQLIYRDLISSWDNATTLSKSLRAKLSKDCPLEIKLSKKEKSKDSTKVSLKMEDGKRVETVLINNNDGRHTVCVSSQIGCSLACEFCATGEAGFIRNLTDYEIIEQVLYFARILKRDDKKIDNIVYMGMGEPFLNINNVMSSINILNNEEMFGIGARKISISTAGIKNSLKKIIKSKLQINLAISLHAPNDKLRSELMPINRSVHIAELLDMVNEYIRKTNRKVMFEYLLLKGVNDSMANAKNLALLLKNKLCVVNLIQYNDTGKFKSSDKSTTIKFKNILERKGIEVSIRESKGGNIQGACGQLFVKK